METTVLTWAERFNEDCIRARLFGLLLYAHHGWGYYIGGEGWKQSAIEIYPPTFGQVTGL